MKPKEGIWLVPFLYGLLLFLAGALWLAEGMPFDMATYERIAGAPWNELAESHPGLPDVLSALVRLPGGNSGLLAGLFIMMVAATGFRGGERWAWWLCWALPIHSAVDLAVVARYGGLGPTVVLWDVSLIAVVAGALAVSYRSFFPGPRGPTDRDGC